jgi:hypothetical protein
MSAESAASRSILNPMAVSPVLYLLAMRGVKRLDKFTKTGA